MESQSMKKLISKTIIGLAASTILMTGTAFAGGGNNPAPKGDWHHKGVTGTYDRAALQRGYQVYKEVCAACHSMDLVHFRNLSELGFSEEEVKAIAAEYEVTDGPDDDGEMFQRPAIPADKFINPYANEKQARASNNGALPVDQSLIVKARAGGEDYLHALLTGYKDAPEGFVVSEGMYYNQYFDGHQIAMAPPLVEDAVTFADDTPATVDQQAKDVVTFLAWAGDPYMEDRKRMGIKVILFLIVFSGMMYVVKRKLWKDVK